MNLNSIMIGSERPERLVEYYTQIFGKPGYQDESFSGWQLGTGWMNIGPHDQVKGKNAHPGRIIWNLEEPDVKGAFEKLRDAGATVVREPYQPAEGADMWIATFADPDDNYFQLMSPM